MMKEFFKSPKKTAILGLVGSVIMLISTFLSLNTYNLMLNMYNFYIIGLVIYFIIILMRLYKQKGNINVANYMLIATYILSIVGLVITTIAEGESISYMLIEILFMIIIIVYFCNILLRKFKIFNNKIFAVLIIGLSLYQLFRFGMFIFVYDEIELNLISYFVKYLAYIVIVPYFYNYYELLKEEQ